MKKNVGFEKENGNPISRWAFGGYVWGKKKVSYRSIPTFNSADVFLEEEEEKK